MLGHPRVALQQHLARYPESGSRVKIWLRLSGVGFKPKSAKTVQNFLKIAGLLKIVKIS